MTSPSPAALTRSTPEGPPAPKRFRIRGIDLARGVAMLGMLAAHVGPSADDGTVVGSVMALAQGRSSILFATLAGVSLALMSGGRDIGASSRVAAQKIAVRAVLILALGTALVALGTPVKVILAYYGVFFLLSLPFLRLAPRTLFILAGATAVAGPIASMLLRSSAVVTGALAQIDRVDPIALLSGEGVTRLLLTGVYPAITWMPFLFVGLGLGRIGVQRLRKVRLLVWGVGLMIVGYGGAFAARLLVPGAVPTWEASKKDFGSMLDKSEGAEMKPFGEGKPTGEVEWASLLSADQHTGAPFEIIGGIGAALVVLAASIWLSAPTATDVAHRGGRNHVVDRLHRPCPRHQRLRTQRDARRTALGAPRLRRGRRDLRRAVAALVPPRSDRVRHARGRRRDRRATWSPVSPRVADDSTRHGSDARAVGHRRAAGRVRRGRPSARRRRAPRGRPARRSRAAPRCR